MRPEEIERRSMAIIDEEIRARGMVLPEADAPVIRRVIHTTADFDYLDTLVFSEGASGILRDALAGGADIVTDTEMARAGINKRTLSAFGGKVHCFMADPDVAHEAKKRGTTRAAVSMERAMHLYGPLLFAIGNAPTALLALAELLKREDYRSKAAGIIAVPVGFVNVIEAKEQILALPVPHIAARGRKGGSNVAAAIVNALLYAL